LWTPQLYSISSASPAGAAGADAAASSPFCG
jgi:hypothetical protein